VKISLYSFVVKHLCKNIKLIHAAVVWIVLKVDTQVYEEQCFGLHIASEPKQEKWLGRNRTRPKDQS
jgi:membrane-anchored protein YejM (alkaline phosphatase superfamily)